jgi:hypothetical protein
VNIDRAAKVPASVASRGQQGRLVEIEQHVGGEIDTNLGLGLLDLEILGFAREVIDSEIKSLVGKTRTT